MFSTSLLRSRSGFSAIVYEDKYLFVVGGNDGRILNKVEALDLDTYEWRKFARMHTKRDELAVTLGPDGKIYAIGGYGGADRTCLSSAERYDPRTDEWEQIAPMQSPRRALAAVALPDGVYAIGGYNGKQYLNTVERYDELTNEWVLVSSMSKARCTLSACSS
jgi:N-acetylneuraminic acid mutarotase